MSRRKPAHPHALPILCAIGWIARYPDGYVTRESVGRHVQGQGIGMRSVDETLYRIAKKGWLDHHAGHFFPTRMGRAAIVKACRRAGMR